MNKLISLTAVGVMAAGSALAGEALVQSATITSVTTLPQYSVTDPTNKVWMFLKASGNESVTLIYKDKTGTELSTQAVAVGTTYTSVTAAAPQYFKYVKPSPTTVSGGDSVNFTFIQTKDSGF